MEHLNYCRQATPVLRWNEQWNKHEEVRKDCSMALNSLSLAVKFLLPTGGRLLPDPDLRGLDGCEMLSLPFPVVALEYGDGASDKRITIATQRDEDIALQHIVYTATTGAWTPTCLILLSRDVPIRIRDGLPDARPMDEACPQEIAVEPAVALLSLLNALQCSNVRIERSEPRRSRKKAASALPFDAYHILTIDAPSSGRTGGATGGHRSPREHLRRGHIRRLGDGRRIWVNATVVSAGSGGVVSKDYRLKTAPAKTPPHRSEDGRQD